MTAADILANARALSGFLREKSDAIEEARRLPGEVAARLRQAGMFRLMMPQEWGGPEMRPAEQVEVIEELAQANASAAWCVRKRPSRAQECVPASDEGTTYVRPAGSTAREGRFCASAHLFFEAF